MSEDALYRELILEEYKHPRNRGQLAGATHTAHVKNPLCGDELTLQLRIEGHGDAARITDVRFTGQGCAISQASASLFTEHLKDKTVRDVAAMDERVITGLLGITPNPMRMKCAVLVLRAAAGALGIDTATKTDEPL